MRRGRRIVTAPPCDTAAPVIAPPVLAAPSRPTRTCEARLSAGADFVVVICEEIMTMPGLPKVPSAEAFGLDADGQVVGLF